MSGLGLALLAMLVAIRPVEATFHITDFVEIFSNDDGTIQYIELQMQSNLQHAFDGAFLQTDANLYEFPNDLPDSNTLNRSNLIATQAFADLPGAPTPDFIIPENFFNINGDTITLITGTFGPFTFSSGQLPTDGLTALRKNLTAATNSPTNFAGVSGSVDATPLDPNNVYVDFALGQNGRGTQTSPFDNLADAVAAANSSATIHLGPGTSAETFSNAQAITKAMTLQNSDPGSGSVAIGSSGARGAGVPLSGFVSRGVTAPE